MYKKNNQLLTWFEEFYSSCCDGDWEYNTGGIGLLGTCNAWLFRFSILELELVNKNFDPVFIKQNEGIMECYKKEELYDDIKIESSFIVRTH